MGSMMNCMFDTPEQHKFAKIWVDGINQVKKRAIINLSGFDEAEKFISSVPKQENILFVQQSTSGAISFLRNIFLTDSTNCRYSALVAVPEMFRCRPSRRRRHHAQRIIVRPAVIYRKPHKAS
jgi:hypothetical protein